MRKLNVQVPPFNTTLIGMLKGISDHFGLAHSDAALYGVSGHAFVIHIHKALCPSGPYCWDRTPLEALTKNLGIEIRNLGFFHEGATDADRDRIASVLRAEIDAGNPCGLVNMEFQLVTGYDETGFLTTQPWPCNDFPPAHLHAKTWEEFGEVHANFFTFAPCPPAGRRTAFRAALMFAVELWDSPKTYAGHDFGMGPDAYQNWLAAIPEHGGEHGNWWNATVYGECRAQAAAYLREMAELVPEAGAVAEDYTKLATLFAKAGDREATIAEKLGAVREAFETEKAAVGKLRALLEV
jgi:hypothetical protein